MKLLVVSALLCALMALSGADAAAEPDPQETNADVSVAKRTSSWYRIGHRHFLFVSDPMTWQQAEAHCHSLGGHLASVHHSWEHKRIQALVRKHTHGYPEVWLGGNDIHQEGVWHWSDGSSFDYQHWCHGEPNNGLGSNQDCLQMSFSAHKCWDDLWCHHRIPSLCVG